MFWFENVVSQLKKIHLKFNLELESFEKTKQLKHKLLRWLFLPECNGAFLLPGSCWEWRQNRDLWSEGQQRRPGQGRQDRADEPVELVRPMKFADIEAAADIVAAAADIEAVEWSIDPEAKAKLVLEAEGLRSAGRDSEVVGECLVMERWPEEGKKHEERSAAAVLEWSSEDKLEVDQLVEVELTCKINVLRTKMNKKIFSE